MNESQQLANRFREVILNGTWVANTNYRHQLEATDRQTATTTVEPLPNSIAVLAQHIHYYIRGVNHAFATGQLEIRDKYSFDFAPVTSDEQWQAFLTTFWDEAEQYAVTVAQLTDEQLDSAFINEQYGSYRRNIDAMIEHCYYHLGQIVLLRKLAAVPTTD